MSAFALLSINVASPRTIEVGGKSISTGHFKSPRSGPVEIDTTGINVDSICDQANHGGVDQAIYIFSAEDLKWWKEQLEQDVRPGYFGENLTIDRWWPSPRVGDRLTIGTVQLELSFPRIPCATLAARVGDSKFLKAFVAARRPGSYARVLRAGAAEAGSAGYVQAAPTGNPLVDDLFAIWHSTPKDHELLRRALASPIAERARPRFEVWLSESGSVDEA